MYAGGGFLCFGVLEGRNMPGGEAMPAGAMGVGDEVRVAPKTISKNRVIISRNKLFVPRDV